MKFDYRKAAFAQEMLRKKVTLKPLKGFKFVGGCDLTFLNPFKTPTTGIACFVVLKFPSLEVVEISYAFMEVKVPYVPGFLAFREVPLLIKAYSKLSLKPDVIIVDGQGIAHPRRVGLASHFGVVMGLSTVGCAKKPLFGEFDYPCDDAGCFSYIKDPSSEEVIGVVLRTKKAVKPVFVSPGNFSDVETSKDLIINCCRGYRLPEPVRLAHNLLTRKRKDLL
jgi:deoxyribonuclease V